MNVDKDGLNEILDKLDEILKGGGRSLDEKAMAAAGAVVTALMEALGCNAQQLATKIGVSVQSVERWKNGKATMRSQSIKAIRDLVEAGDLNWGTKPVNPYDIGIELRKDIERLDMGAEKIWIFSTDEFLDRPDENAQGETNKENGVLYNATQQLLKRGVTMCYVFPKGSRAERSWLDLMDRTLAMARRTGRSDYRYLEGFQITDTRRMPMFLAGVYAVVWQYPAKEGEVVRYEARLSVQPDSSVMSRLQAGGNNDAVNAIWIRKHEMARIWFDQCSLLEMLIKEKDKERDKGNTQELTRSAEEFIICYPLDTSREGD